LGRVVNNLLNPDSNVSQMIDQIDDIFFSIAYGIVFSQIIMSFCDIFESEFMRFNISVILSYFFALILLIEWFREWAIWVRRERPSGEFPFLKVCLYYLPALLWIEAMVHYVTYVPLFALITLGYWLINLDYDIINYYYYLRRRLHFDAYRLRNMKICQVRLTRSFLSLPRHSMFQAKSTPNIDTSDPL